MRGLTKGDTRSLDYSSYGNFKRLPLSAESRASCLRVSDKKQVE